MDNLKHAYFFAIDISWFNKWRSFVYNDDKSCKYLENFKKYISDNKKIGILPPCTIDNSKICIPNKDKKKNSYIYKLKPGLIADKDYFVVNQYLWEWFLLNYSGGPEIRLPEEERTNLNNYNSLLSNKSNSIILMGEDDFNEKNNINNKDMNIDNKNCNNKFEENKENDFENFDDKKKKYKMSIEKKEEVKILNKNYNSKMTDIKAPKKKSVEDKVFEPEIKQRLIKSLISDINI